MAELQTINKETLFQQRPDVAANVGADTARLGRWLKNTGAGELASMGFQLDPQAVYSAGNIKSAMSGTSYPTDLLGIRNQIYSDLGVTASQEAYNQALTASRAQQTALENAPMSLNVIRGAQAEAQRLSTDKLEVLGRDLQTKLNEANFQYGIRAQELQEKRQLQLQYPGAGIKLSDSSEKAAEKIQKYKKSEEDRSIKQEWEAYKKKTDYTNRLDYDTWLKKSEWTKAHAKGSSGSSKKALQQEGIAGFQSIFDQIRGADGYVNPSDYKAARSQWVANGLSASEFDSIFEPYRNPYDKLYGTKYIKEE
jgi:hypothetical protein